MEWVVMVLIIYKQLVWENVHPCLNRKIVRPVVIIQLVLVSMILWGPVRLEPYHKIQNWVNLKSIQNISPKNVANHPLDGHNLTGMMIENPFSVIFDDIPGTFWSSLIVKSDAFLRLTL